MEQNLINFKRELLEYFRCETISSLESLFQTYEQLKSVVDEHGLENVLANLNQIKGSQNNYHETKQYVVKTKDEVDIKSFCTNLIANGFIQINKYYGFIPYDCDNVDLQYSDVLIYCEPTKTFLLCNDYDDIDEMIQTLFLY